MQAHQSYHQLIEQLNDQRDLAVALLTHPPISVNSYKNWCLTTKTTLSRLFGDSFTQANQFDFPDSLNTLSESQMYEIVNHLQNQIHGLDNLIKQLESESRCQRNLIIAPGVVPSPITEERNRLNQGNDAAKIFISYAHADREQVEALFDQLTSIGYIPWMDSRNLLGGEEWATAIRKAVRQSDFFLAIISRNSYRRRGWIQKEIKIALSSWKEKLEDDIYLIPVRLVNCEIPGSLSHLQYVDLWEPDGWGKLKRAIEVGIARRQE